MAESESSSVTEYGLLDGSAKKRYDAKLASIGNAVKDPYSVNSKAENLSDLLPLVKFGDLYNFLITAPSLVTKEDLKAWKSMDGRKYLLAGWVGALTAYESAAREKIVVKAKVRHSQSVNAAELQPWVAAETSGTIICAHCTCKAGLGEACSHIAAVLFALVSHTEAKLQSACTSQPCQWLSPTLQSVQYKRIAEMDLTSPSKKARKTRLSSNSSSAPITPQNKVPAKPPTSSELEEFYGNLFQVSKPALLSIVPGYAESYVASLPENFPPPLSTLYEDSMLGVTYVDLLDRCDAVFAAISVSPDESSAIESASREQAQSDVWFQYRAGRITASKFKAASRSDPHQPSTSLIKGICYPESVKFSSIATSWGCEHEALARDAYKQRQQKEHTNLQVSDSGLVVRTDYPHLGATPDGAVTCTCCGKGVLEVKCPYSCRDSSIKDWVETSSSCLGQAEDGSNFLKKDHAYYYYQVQAQIFICQVAFCDFVVFSEKDLVVLRINAEPEFISAVLNTVTSFFKLAVLPEMVGKYFSKTFVAPTGHKSLLGDVGAEVHPSACCLCQEEKQSETVACANSQCSVGKFHLSCLRMKSAPKRKWYCPSPPPPSVLS